jgi:hypothetical protein
MHSGSLKLMSLIAVAGLILVPSPSRADGYGWGANPFVRAGLNACGGDIARLCSNVVPGGGRIAQCLADHPGALSPPCSTLMHQARDARFAVFACSADVSRLCGDVLPGGGRIVMCLRSKMSGVSPACKEGLDRVNAALDR